MYTRLLITSEALCLPIQPHPNHTFTLSIPSATRLHIFSQQSARDAYISLYTIFHFPVPSIPQSSFATTDTDHRYPSIIRFYPHPNLTIPLFFLFLLFFHPPLFLLFIRFFPPVSFLFFLLRLCHSSRNESQHI